MSDRSLRTPSTSAEGSQAAFETAVEVLSGFREENPSPTTDRRQEASSPWIPKTAEEAAYDQCEKLSTTTTMANVRRGLGIPSGNKHNDYVWQQLSVSPTNTPTVVQLGCWSIANVSGFGGRRDKRPSLRN
ncbi:hypothetical protein TWF192_005725 [Orbilia oligospora]|uniref:Uncharacterized protein n=1 Tax=Orbilia oligospora TaxID=2813651 RepID=A0A6G1MMP3_ORBOL|nr:hypothetical protein TWF191_003914 [Orbilia oligospora]KAF3263444.1 hypothetical protein TWF192_005725 [Orbilia oligospora]